MNFLLRENLKFRREIDWDGIQAMIRRVWKYIYNFVKFYIDWKWNFYGLNDTFVIHFIAYCRNDYPPLLFIFRLNNKWISLYI